MYSPLRSKKDLEIILQKLKKPENYKGYLEQYPTDAALAAEVLFIAYLDGNLDGKTIGDFGAGNGVFSLGSAMLGASKVFAVEVDADQCELIRENTKGFNVEIINSNIEEFHTRVDTVIMNPPFGSVVEHSDRVFLEKAVELSGFIYSLHNFKSAEFVDNFYKDNASIIRRQVVNIRIPRLYKHHSKDHENIKALFYTCEV